MLSLVIYACIQVRWKTRSAECGKCGVWKMRSVENEECGKCGVWKMRSVENVNMKLTKNLIPLYSFIFSLKECFIILWHLRYNQSKLFKNYIFMAKSNNIFWSNSNSNRNSNEYVNKRLKWMRLALLWIHEINKRSKLVKNGMHPYILTAKSNNIFFPKEQERIGKYKIKIIALSNRSILFKNWTHP